MPTPATGRRRSDSCDNAVAAALDGAYHLSLAMPMIEDLGDAARRMEQLGITHGDVTELPSMGIAILSFQDPDDINLELVTLLDR